VSVIPAKLVPVQAGSVFKNVIPEKACARAGRVAEIHSYRHSREGGNPVIRYKSFSMVF
jgi:hypothetical protein